ncbi:bola protein [Infundibulicybe gibba]|nr:bola protein [Infundibulicybe gibba]
MFALIRRLVPTTTLNLRRLATNQSTPAPPSDLTEGEQVIHAKLADRFAPSQLQVQDVSGGCGSFYAITIASQAFKGLPIVKQHKLVTETLKKDIEGIHGLQIKTIVE